MPRLVSLLGIALITLGPVLPVGAQTPSPFHLLLIPVASAPVNDEEQAPAPGQSAPRLFIKILEGEEAVNNVKARTAREPVIEVDDENHKPVAGALVTFFAPNQGPGGLFVNQQTLTTMTDATGRAVGKGFHPNNVAGQFSIEVTATYAGAVVKSMISERNVSVEGSSHAGTQTSSGIFGSKVLVILGVVAAGATAGIVYAVAHGSSAPSATITGPGTATVGPSH